MSRSVVVDQPATSGRPGAVVATTRHLQRGKYPPAFLTAKAILSGSNHSSPSPPGSQP